MKKSLILAVVALSMMYMPVKAQATYSATASASVTTNVLSALTINESANVNFGTVSSGTTPTLSPLGVTNSATKDVGNGATVGEFDITGANNGTILVNFPSTVTLGPTTTNGGAGSVTFTPDINAGNTQATPNTGETNISTSTPVTLDASGTTKLWVGGNLDLSGVTTNGGFTGTMTVSVYYQ